MYRQCQFRFLTFGDMLDHYFETWESGRVSLFSESPLSEVPLQVHVVVHTGNFLKFRTGRNFLYPFLDFLYTCPGKLQDMCRKVYRKLCPIQLQESWCVFRKYTGDVLYQEISLLYEYGCSNNTVEPLNRQEF